MIGIFGGTFDPVHYGHLRTALELSQQLNLKEVRFIPCQKPVLNKISKASAEQRLAMLKLAINNQPNFVIDERELKRDTPSYTIDTLISLRAENKNEPLGLIIGSDTLVALDKWHRWQELIQYAHLILVTRPDFIFPSEGIIANFIAQHQITDSDLLHQKTNGYLFVTRTTQLNISATAIRKEITDGRSPRYLLPESVFNYIQQEKLYL